MKNGERRLANPSCGHCKVQPATVRTLYAYDEHVLYTSLADDKFFATQETKTVILRACRTHAGLLPSMLATAINNTIENNEFEDDSLISNFKKHNRSFEEHIAQLCNHAKYLLRIETPAGHYKWISIRKKDLSSQEG